MGKKKDEAPDAIVTPSYRGPERRKAQTGNGEAKPKTHIYFDERGNAILRFTDDTPRRRVGDDTLDYLEALDPDALSLEDDE